MTKCIVCNRLGIVRNDGSLAARSGLTVPDLLANYKPCPFCPEGTREKDIFDLLAEEWAKTEGL